MDTTKKYPKNKAQIFGNPFQSVICETFNCRNRAKYFIGKPEGPNTLLLNLCEDCAKSIIGSIPVNYPELMPVVEVKKKCVCGECGNEFNPEVCFCDDCLDKGEMAEKEIEQENELELTEFQHPTCQYCGKECKPKGLAAHERNCPKNPGTKDEQK